MTKESRRKLRRWTYAAQITKANGETVGFRTRALSIGPDKHARDNARQFEKDIREMPQYKDAKKIVVVPEPHETISLEVEQQLRGMNQELVIANVALSKACEKWIAGEKPLATVDETVGQILQDARIQALGIKPEELAAGTPAEAPATEPDEKIDLAKLQEAAYGEQPAVEAPAA